ncbi:uncharacterized protein FIBRA_04753 [Fibroporia radiculosa]|uniref:CNH domain-containing protein n=1 Tax=Fibroporia radiculosa TaxID=599839 RepID=J4H348_9APHY|nr:uncharacterized protein FIBRA_04753 [Fibroporia radiculosa]CCM02649.1 predicted protein [Fibroporia radiculosa]
MLLDEAPLPNRAANQSFWYSRGGDDAREANQTSVMRFEERASYTSNLVFEFGEPIDLDLQNEARLLVHAGKMQRRKDLSFGLKNLAELFVMLFDHYLLLAKPKQQDETIKYHVYGRPIPLELLILVNFTDPPKRRSGSIMALSRSTPRITDDTQLSKDLEIAYGGRVLYPCRIQRRGHPGDPMTLYVESEHARNEWRERLQAAIARRKHVLSLSQIFDVRLLCDVSCAPLPSRNVVVSSDNMKPHGRVTCSVPFESPDGRELIAVGSTDGVWFGFSHNPSSFRHVLLLKNVSQCAVLADLAFFLVLADGVLVAFDLHALISPPRGASTRATKPPQALCEEGVFVEFFCVGLLNGRPSVVCMNRKGTTSLFHIFTPNLPDLPEYRECNDMFRLHREFFIPSEAYDLVFLGSKISILCPKGFEVMDVTEFYSVTLPVREDTRLRLMTKRHGVCRPIGMIRTTEGHFLLCYKAFGFYVDNHGDPCSSSSIIEWEGVAERVAWHPPYVLLFSPTFIEVRHAMTGRLAQIIPGIGVGCLYDGRRRVPYLDDWSPGVPQEPRVHGLMRPGSAPSNDTPAEQEAQFVFELVPTIPAYSP